MVLPAKKAHVGYDSLKFDHLATVLGLVESIPIHTEDGKGIHASDTMYGKVNLREVRGCMGGGGVRVKFQPCCCAGAGSCCEQSSSLVCPPDARCADTAYQNSPARGTASKKREPTIVMICNSSPESRGRTSQRHGQVRVFKKNVWPHVTTRISWFKK